jgi:hypothetical protein
MVIPAASVVFFRPEFDGFLCALIGADENEMPLSVLSALARLDLDPWKVAVELSELPKNIATQRLSTLIARLPAGRWAQADSGAIADRLIELLPSSSSSKTPLAEKGQGRPEMTVSTVAMLLICAALAVTALIIAASPEPSSHGDHNDAAAFSTTSPSQTPPQSQ